MKENVEFYTRPGGTVVIKFIELRTDKATFQLENCLVRDVFEVYEELNKL